MLAQSFKTAEQLKITEEQYAALQKTLVWFETEQATHQKELPSIWERNAAGVITYNTRSYRDSDDDLIPKEAPAKFNLGCWIVVGSECGTIACIGGTASILGNVSFVDWEDHSGLRPLFNPQGVTHSAVTIEQAARALRNFLQTGHASWRKAKKGF